MAASYRYDLANALVCDPVAANRMASRNALFGMGFRNIEMIGSCDDLRQWLGDNDTDLLVIEASENIEEACRVMQEIRQGKTGRNPFLIIIATTWQTSGEIVRGVVGAGADDLLVRPFSVKQVADRIRTHVDARKGFVVTSDYIGPDRRRDSQRPSDAQLIAVPNSLKLRAAEGLPAQAAAVLAARAIEKSRSLVNLEKMRRSAFQIGVLADFLKEAANTGASPEMRRADVERVRALNEELARRAAESGFEGLNDLCGTVTNVVKSVEEGKEQEKNAIVLSQLAIAMQVVLTPDRTDLDHEEELKRVLAKVRARGRAT
ncbi:MAG TPA: hypothetical protein PL096_05585 [Micropepsaceae bacterium]|nr:hypothetical protein [Micropepsaceae bacterium]